jgi:hypothetical protein
MKLIKYAVIFAIASISSGCGNKDTKVCVDKDGKIVEDGNCHSSRTGGAHMWYYGSRTLGIGERATGGSTTAKPGVSYTTRRSGFGSSSHSGSSS